MLTDAPFYAVIPASDIDRARRWYEEKLAVTPEKEEFGSYWYAFAGGSGFLLTPSEFAGSAQNTAGGFSVTDIEATMAKLRARGVVFEEYDMPEFKTVNGVFTEGDIKVAWFKDSEGNIIVINQTAPG